MNLPINIPVTSRLYRLEQDWSFSWREERLRCNGLFAPRICIILIKQGTLNDGASVPRPLWSVVRPDGLIRGAALIHDVLFEARGKPHTTYKYFEGDLRIDRECVPVERVARTFTLREANNLFGLCMMLSKVPVLDRVFARSGVAIGSKFIWDSYPQRLNERILDYIRSRPERTRPETIHPPLNEVYIS